MSFLDPDQTTLLKLAPCSPGDADAIVLPVPLEMTVSYGQGTLRGPSAILEASTQIETFDEEWEFDFERDLRIHNAAPLSSDGGRVKDYLEGVAESVRQYDSKFVLGLGGEHTVTWGLIKGLSVSPEDLTVIQIDAHADLRDQYEGEEWSHACVMRRVLDEGCRLIQIGIRSTAREEFELIGSEPRVQSYYAHQMHGSWAAILETIGLIRGPVYLTLDVDGIDPSILPSTGTPQPGGLSWSETMEVLRALSSNKNATWVGADVVEFVPSPNPPGCDIIAAKLPVKILASWATGRRK